MASVKVNKTVTNKSSITFQSMSWRERLHYTRSLITVEPLIACYIMGITLPITAFRSLQWEKACRIDAGLNASTCAAITGGNPQSVSKENEQMQQHIIALDTWLVPTISIIPLLLSLLWGSFSDRHQVRKPFLLLPVVGELVSITACILNVVFLYEWDLTTFAIGSQIITSFFGGSTLLVVALFAYIADISTVEERTLRVAFGQIVIAGSRIVAQPIGALVFTTIGYYGSFGIALLIMSIGFAYGVFCVKEGVQPKKVDNKKILFLDLFDPRHIFDVVSVLFVRKPGNNRLQIMCVMIIFFISNGVYTGETSVIYLFLQIVFEFTSANISYLETFATLIYIKGDILGAYLFTKFFKWSDYTIMYISLLDKVVANVIMTLASTNLVLFIGIYVGLFKGFAIIILRSLATKIVSQEDIGKAQSFFGICETLGAAAFSPIYTKLIYYNTAQTFPGAFFLAVIPFFLLCIAVVVLMQWKQHSEQAINRNCEITAGYTNEAMVPEISHM